MSETISAADNTPFPPSELKEITEIQANEIWLIKNLAKSLAQRFDLIGDGREISIAKTRLDEAVMWAVNRITA